MTEIFSFTVEHYFLRNPEESMRSLGVNRGCFETPTNKHHPNKVVCHDIDPLHRQTNKTDVTKMRIQDRLVHPDSVSERRYILGTRLQQKLQKSHKLPTCQFHNIDLAEGTEDISTMLQESLQNVRKNRTIQGDKLASFERCFLANYIVDFYHNHEVTLEQKTSLLKGNTQIEREPDLWRAVVKK